MSLSTHVLDVSTGHPAAEVGLTLERREADGSWSTVAETRTDGDGRARDLDGLQRAVYRVTFAIGSYFAARGVASFHPEAAVTFAVAAPTEHHHVPLLVSPFGYTTYRGS